MSLTGRHHSRRIAKGVYVSHDGRFEIARTDTGEWALHELFPDPQGGPPFKQWWQTFSTKAAALAAVAQEVTA